MVVVSKQGKYLDKNRFYKKNDKYFDLIPADYKIIRCRRHKLLQEPYYAIHLSCIFYNTCIFI